ncbi:MAG TPA: GNAT family N-acetyltransferase [Candidatus Paceibacterota bacterium]|nr:GNAT family N-acetyltransferase [Candidatus Paceibacterota bacterium]
MNSEIEIVNALDPRCLELETAGYTVVGESWGAHLRLSDPIDLSLYAGKISGLQTLGYQVESLALGLANQVLELEVTNNPDYPYTPATAHATPTFESTRNLWKAGNGVFGAFKEGLLVGVVAASKGAKEVNIDFGSVRREHRGLGVGSAIVSLAISTYANLGERLFSTGGAAVNEASHATVRSLGFAVDEQWRSYQRPN